MCQTECAASNTSHCIASNLSSDHFEPACMPQSLQHYSLLFHAHTRTHTRAKQTYLDQMVVDGILATSICCVTKIQRRMDPCFFLAKGFVFRTCACSLLCMGWELGYCQNFVTALWLCSFHRKHLSDFAGPKCCLSVLISLLVYTKRRSQNRDVVSFPSIRLALVDKTLLTEVTHACTGPRI